MYNLPPKKMEIIKLRGSEAILDLKNCGLGKGAGGKIISELVRKMDKFESVDLSFNDINQDLV
jgi:Ran GTPase-activating protein (RanGAP) involved in mRNA processing and transport